jgi:hypothetical protein
MSPTRRAQLFFLTVIFITTATIASILLARGYKIDFTDKKLQATGLLVATSIPDGAQVWIDNQLRSATNTTISLPPGKYNVELKKDGFSTWQKYLTLKAEEVVKTDTSLFPTVPSLRALTFSGASGPVLSASGNQLVYAVPLQYSSPASPSATTSSTKPGLWVMDLGDLPLGLAREPRQIALSTTSTDWSKATLKWAPDGHEILALFYKTATTAKSSKPPEVRYAYLLDSSRLNRSQDLIDTSPSLDNIYSQWQLETDQLLSAQLAKAHPLVQQFLATAAADLKVSPDETKILYQATASATLPDHVIPPLPGSNSQPQQRSVFTKSIYVYDLKEDRNYLVDNCIGCSWFPTSKHLLRIEKDKITILEYDNTNPVTVYSGPFASQAAFPYPNGSKIIILTNLGSTDPNSNLYSLSLR